MVGQGFEPPYLFWGLVALGLCAGGFYFAFRSWARARVIEDTPTAKIRSAPQGYVELAGRAALMEGEPVLAPLTGSKCCWYRFKIERRGHRNSWKKVDGGASDKLFLLRDETGECIVDPEGAEVTPGERDFWYGVSRHPSHRPSGASRPASGSFRERWGLADLLHVSVVSGRYRYTEERIRMGDPLYALGHFKTLGELDHRRGRSEAAGALLREWKADRQVLLERFDADRDGKIDLQEWEQARSAAQAQAAREHSERLEHQVLHTLRRTTSGRRPFLLSSLQQFNLVRRYRFIALASLAGFFAGGIGLVWILTNRLVV